MVDNPSSETMRAVVMEERGGPLLLRRLPVPYPDAGELQVRVRACGICRTDLHVLDGELGEPKLPLVLGHQVVGRVSAIGSGVRGFEVGDRVGIPWLGGTCGSCRYCASGRENLCDEALFTGYQVDGGFAEYAVASARFCFPIPGSYPDLQAAPLLCAGLIGYRALRLAGDAEVVGIYGFGAAAHIVAQVLTYQGRRFHAFVRPGDEAAKRFARGLGAAWSGGSDEDPPEELDAALLFAPVGELVPIALGHVRKGGTVVCGGIHMSPVPSFSYDLLWGERSLVSVANLTREDGLEFLELAPRVPVETVVRPYALEEAALAFDDLREGRLEGAAVLVIEGEESGPA